MKQQIKKMLLLVSFVLLTITCYGEFKTPEETISNFFNYQALGDTNGLNKCFVGRKFYSTGEKPAVSYEIAAKRVYKKNDVEKYKQSFKGAGESNNLNVSPKTGDVELTILNKTGKSKTYYLFRKVADQWLILTLWADKGSETSSPPALSSSVNNFILTTDNVNVRAKANIKSKILAKIKMGQKVKLIKRTDVALTAGDKKGFWAWVEFEKNGKTVKGYVFDAYLEEEK